MAAADNICLGFLGGAGVAGAVWAALFLVLLIRHGCVQHRFLGIVSAGDSRTIGTVAEETNTREHFRPATEMIEESG